ncbi:hypothetical protein DH2020_013059 [Rehmannia glutinosa]|uniref:HNH endonuclease n=1 Tax=Rehmannia glutinosa TaxID=99300 RepID=A0ABR0X502_REHGL
MSSNSSTKEKKRRNKKSFPSSSPTRPASRTRSFSPPPPSATSVVDRELLTEELSLFEALQISPENQNPRSFPHSVKQQCWEKAEKIKGRDPDRWRRDPLGNTVFRKLVGCPGCLCHDYDHIVPYSKLSELLFDNAEGRYNIRSISYYVVNCDVVQWALITFTLLWENKTWSWRKSTLENCQVLQATVNRSKGNRTEMSRSDLIQKSAYCRVSGRDMDLLELSAYGNVKSWAGFWWV